MADQTLTLVQAKLSNRASSRQQVSRAPPSNRVVRQVPTRPLAARTRPPSSDRRALTRQLQRKRGKNSKSGQKPEISREIPKFEKTRDLAGNAQIENFPQYML